MLDLKILNKLAMVNIPSVSNSTGTFTYEKKVPYNIEPYEVTKDAKYRSMEIKLLVEQYSTPMEKCVSMIATFYIARYTRQEYDLFISKHKDNKDLINLQHSIFNISRTISELICEDYNSIEEVAKTIFTSAMIVLILYKEPELFNQFNWAYLPQVDTMCKILHEFEGPTRTVQKEVIKSDISFNSINNSADII